MASSDMEVDVPAVDRIINYSFKNKYPLEQSLTHSSYNAADSYEKLELAGKDALELAVRTYLYLAYLKFNPDQLSQLCSANIGTKKLARIAVQRGLYQYLRHNSAALDDEVKEFVDALNKENDTIEVPKVLTDIVQAVAGAICVDIKFDMAKLWTILRGLLDPLVTSED